MLTEGMDIFIQFSGESRRRLLHPGQVAGAQGGRYTLNMEPTDATAAAGQEAMIFFTLNRQFLRQSICIESVLTLDPRLIIVVRPIGEPIFAESRQCYRVCTALGHEYATVNGELCRLMDISATGFAFATNQKYDVNQRLDAELNDEGENFRGRVIIQNCKDLGGGRYRYGVHCVDDHRTGNLHKGVQRLSMAIQRRQLRRVSGRPA